MNDETTRGTGGVFSTSAMELVREGMTVVDADGEKVGEVDYVQMGDPQAATVQGNEYDSGGLLGDIARAVAGDETEPDVPEPKKAQLVRYGFLKVDGEGLFGADRYVRADRVASVSGDTVRLRVRKAELPKED